MNVAQASTSIPISQLTVAELLRTLANTQSSLSTARSGSVDAASALEVVAQYIRGNDGRRHPSGPSSSAGRRRKKPPKRSGRAVHREDKSKKLSVSDAVTNLSSAHNLYP